MHINTNKDYWNLFLSSLAVFLSTFYVLFWSFHVIALIYGKYKFGSKRSIKNKVVDKFDDLPGVTILKPLKGVDDNLMENLTTFFNIDYPYYELIFCIQDENDPAIDVVKRLMAKYPIIDTKLFYGGKIVCANPKISNLCQGYPHAKYNYILISDSGIKTTKDALYDMVCLMNKDVGLVHQMPYCCDRPGKMSNLLEKIYFGTWQARNYLFINFFGLNCVVGMSCLMRKSVIDECGGLIHFGKYIAEDFFLAQAFIDRKYKTPMSHEPAWQNSAHYSPAIWRARVIRWTQLRVRLSVPSWIEPFAECFLQGLYGAWCLYYFTTNLNYCIVFYFLHVMIWYLLDYVQLLIIENGEFKYSIFKCFPVWLYRETISYWIFFRGVMSQKVKWRSGTYKLKFGGHGVRVETNKPSTSSRLCFWKPRERLGSNSTISIASYSQKEIKPPAMQQRFVGASENSSNKISSII